MNSRKPTLFTGLWVGEALPPLARLCISSFIAQGHRFQLFCYREYDNMPAGVLLRDARDILPEEDIFRDSDHNSLAPFSDWFRMKFLSEEGGFWVDMDVVCLKKEAPEEDVWFCRQNDWEVAVGAMRFPANHPVPTALSQLANDPATLLPWDSAEDVSEKEKLRESVSDIKERRRRIPWGYCGPTGITKALKYYALYERAASPSDMYPVSWPDWKSIYTGEARLDSPAIQNAWSIHLWGEMLRLQPQMWNDRAETCLINELMSMYHISTQSRSQEEKERVSILIGICTCHSARERRDACRETWLSSIPEGIAYKFFLGNKTREAASSPEDKKRPPEDFSDVVALDVNDSYPFLPAKGIAFYKYALQHYDFDWLFKCDDDTYVALERLASVCREGYDMIGDISVAKRGAPSGGAGYLMSRQLVEQFVAHESEISKTGAEDVIFGCMARELGACMRADERLNLGNTPCPTPGNELVSCHWCSPQKLRDIHLLRFHQEEAEVYTAVHPYWRDEIKFFPNGRFMRSQSGCCGKYRYEDGKRILRLIWDEWPEERLVLQPSGNYFREPGFCIFMGKEKAPPMECMPGERPLKCVILTTPGEVAEGARRAMQLGYEVEIYPTTQDTSALTDTRAEDSAAYINRPPESAERPHVRSLRASFIRMLRDARYQGQENIIFCESDAVPTMPAAELLRYVQETLNAHPNADVLRPFQALCTLDHLVEEAFTKEVEFSRMERHPEHDCCTAKNWGTHALIVPCRSREKLAKIFAECRLPMDVALSIANGRDELEAYTCSHDLFYQKRREKLPRRHRIAGLLTSYKRLKELQRQIGCMMAQDDEDFHLFVAIKGISERDYHRIIEPQFRHFVQAGRLTMRLFPNRNQLSNLLDTVRDLDISSWDLFAKIDDDDIYAHDYISQLHEYHAMLPEGLGSYHCGDGGYYHLEKGFPVVGIGHFGFYGPTLVIPKRVLELLFDYEKEPRSVLRHFPVAEHGYLLSSFSFREDALIDFINRRMGACNRAAYTCVQGNELSVIVCQDTPSVLRGNYVSHDLMQQVEGTKLDKRANERLVYLKYHGGDAYVKVLGTRVSRLDGREAGEVVCFERDSLMIQWDNRGIETFILHADGSYFLSE